MIPDRNLKLHEELKSVKNDKYVSKYIYFSFLISLKITDDLKQK